MPIRRRLRIGQPVRPDSDQVGGRRPLQRPPRRVQYRGPWCQAGADGQSGPRAQAGDDNARAPPDLPGRARPEQPEPPGVVPCRAVLAEIDRGPELRLRAVSVLGDPPDVEVQSRGADLVVRRAHRAGHERRVAGGELGRPQVLALFPGQQEGLHGQLRRRAGRTPAEQPGRDQAQDHRGAADAQQGQPGEGASEPPPGPGGRPVGAFFFRTDRGRRVTRMREPGEVHLTRIVQSSGNVGLRLTSAAITIQLRRRPGVDRGGW